MSWFSNLAEAYDRVSVIAGMNFADEDGGNSEVLVPQNHMAAKTDICVTIDGEGRFLNAELDKKRVSIFIPCTEDSASRTVSIVPHPLHEQLSYLVLDEKKRKAYLGSLSAWCGRNPKAEAVYKYVLGGTLIEDLTECKIEKQDEKLLVRFRVEIPGDKCTNIWEDPELIKAWQDYCADTDKGERVLCYATGISVVPALKHPKGIHVPYNAKLISCNDEANFTYRGRFTKAEQANSVSAAASHKAHSMLKYLIATQGYKCDTQAVVAWGLEDGKRQLPPYESTKELNARYSAESDGKKQHPPYESTSSMLSKLFESFDEDIDWGLDREKGGDENNEDNVKKLEEAQVLLETNYVKRFCNAVGGYGSTKELDKGPRVAVMAIDSATTGRMGITFYQDLSRNEYIERVMKWHQSCCWWFKGEKSYYVSAPSADEIIKAVYGEPKGEGYGYNKIKKQARERLLNNIVGGAKLDLGWVNAAVTRVSQPFSYDKDEKSGGGWDMVKWSKALNVTCAMVRKYYTNDKEEISLELDRSCTNRSYLYGRLLAIADKIESTARWYQLTAGNNEGAGKELKKRIDDSEKRPTNAVRYMARFASKPFHTWKIIYCDQLNPYIQRLDGAEGYQNQIDEIMSLFNDGDYEDDGQLDGRYLLGYSLQRRAFKSQTKDKKGEEFTDESNEEN